MGWRPPAAIASLWQHPSFARSTAGLALVERWQTPAMLLTSRLMDRDGMVRARGQQKRGPSARGRRRRGGNGGVMTVRPLCAPTRPTARVLRGHSCRCGRKASTAHVLSVGRRVRGHHVGRRNSLRPSAPPVRAVSAGSSGAIYAYRRVGQRWRSGGSCESGLASSTGSAVVTVWLSHRARPAGQLI